MRPGSPPHHQNTVCNYLLISVSFLPVPQSTFSSSRLYWFTTVTCTQDISSHTVAALHHLVVLHPSSPSGFGCLTIRYAKPACTRCCPATLTCSSTREYGDWTSICSQRSNQELAASQPDWSFAFPAALSQLCVPVTKWWSLLWDVNTRGGSYFNSRYRRDLSNMLR